MTITDKLYEYMEKNPSESAKMISYLCSERFIDIAKNCNECRYSTDGECDFKKLEEDC